MNNDLLDSIKSTCLEELSFMEKCFETDFEEFKAHVLKQPKDEILSNYWLMLFMTARYSSIIDELLTNNPDAELKDLTKNLDSTMTFLRIVSKILSQSPTIPVKYLIPKLRKVIDSMRVEFKH